MLSCPFRATQPVLNHIRLIVVLYFPPSVFSIELLSSLFLIHITSLLLWCELKIQVGYSVLMLAFNAYIRFKEFDCLTIPRDIHQISNFELMAHSLSLNVLCLLWWCLMDMSTYSSLFLGSEYLWWDLRDTGRILEFPSPELSRRLVEVST